MGKSLSKSTTSSVPDGQDENRAAPSMLSHGGRLLPAVTVDTYNEELPTTKGLSATVPVGVLFGPSWRIGGTG